MDLKDISQLVIRQSTSTTAATVPKSTAIACDAGNTYDGRIGLRVSAIFVILVGSLFGKRQYLYGKKAVLTCVIGAAFPVFANRHKGVGVPEWVFFIAKYFGSGVIIATAFIHVRPGQRVRSSDTVADHFLVACACQSCPHKPMPDRPYHRIRLG